MSSSDIEKGARAQAFVQQPTAAHTSTRASFLPSYERAVNDNMRGFGEPEGQSNLHAFDNIQEPKHTKRRCMKREWLIAAIVTIICLALVLPLAVVIILRKNSTSEKVNSSPAQNFTRIVTIVKPVTKLTISLEQTTTMHTRSVTDTTFSVAPLTITTIAPSTVYVTVTPTPTSTSTPITTLTTTLPQPESTTTPSTETITSMSVSVSVSVSTATASTTETSSSSTSSTSTSTSTTSSSTTSTTSTSSGMSPEESAAWSSVYAQSSANRAALTMVPDFRTSATTLLSITTVENTIEKTSSGPVATLTGHFGFCGVDGAAC
ncbi:hypothetical protein AC579_3707 [Pseudocercospora musae]|uniref:Uncharacterized protein n=1 Tax=Pseudocercospora musae TaxID=113226 RepID=A0A139IJ07_9PEZI|nr:hypothetical protein AC579_3707 [Pseudocercospora musae]